MVDPIDGAIEFEGFLRGQIPPERILLSHEQAELPFHLVASFPWNKAEHARIAGGWIQ